MPRSDSRRSTAASAAARSRAVRRGPRPAPVAALPGVELVRLAIEAYSPSGAASDCWPVIGPVVRSFVLAAKPTETDAARRWLRALARHTAAEYNAGMRLDDPALLLAEDRLAATYRNDAAASKGLSTSSRRTELTYLRELRAAIVPAAAMGARLTGSGHAAADPYTRIELRDLLSRCAASGHAKAARVQAAALLGLACGLDAAEAPAVRGTDVQVTDWGLVVSAPGCGKGRTRPARLVPVLADYEEALARLAARAGDDVLFTSVKGQTTDYSMINKPLAAVAGMPRLSGSRLRTTWMRTLLERGVSYVAMRKAGASTATDGLLSSLADDLDVPFADFVTAVRGGSEPFDRTAFTHLHAVGGAR